MKKAVKGTISDLMFKPLQFSDGSLERLIIIFSSDNTINMSMGIDGKVIKTSSEYVQFIDVMETIENERPIVHSHKLMDSEKFRSCVQEVNPAEFADELLGVSMVVGLFVETVTQQLAQCQSFLTTIKSITDKMHTKPKDFHLGLSGSQGPLAYMVLNSISGNGIDLNSTLQEKDVEKVGGVLIEILTSHLDIDPNDEEQVRKLRAEIEYKIVDAMPVGIKVGNFSLNMDFILKEIEKLKQSIGEDENNA